MVLHWNFYSNYQPSAEVLAMSLLKGSSVQAGAKTLLEGAREVCFGLRSAIALVHTALGRNKDRKTLCSGFRLIYD